LIKEEEEALEDKKTKDEEKWKWNKEEKMPNKNKIRSPFKINLQTMSNKKKRLTSIEQITSKILFSTKINKERTNYYLQHLA